MALPPGNIRLAGYLGGKLDLCIRNRIMAQDSEHLVEPFRHREEKDGWQTEFWGKWFTSAVAACGYTGDDEFRVRLRQSVMALAATQSEDGYIGNYPDSRRLEGWDVWGQKYTLLGLLAWHDFTGDKSILEVARRLADSLIREAGSEKTNIVKNGFYRGMASSSVLKPVVQLYNRTGEQRYLQFAEYIVAQWSGPDGPRLIEKALAGVPVAERFPKPERWWSWENGQKAYEMMTCYDGLVDLYRITGKELYLEAALKTFENILATEIMITGSGASFECWYGGRAKQAHPAVSMSETCVTMMWMKFCANLLCLTGEPRFVEEIERSAYNALLAAMTPDGSSFAKYSPLEGFRELGPPQCGMEMNCCTANGPRAMMLLADVAVMATKEGPVVNLFGEGEATVELPSGNRVRIRQETRYPVEGSVVFSIDPGREARFPLTIRIPAWCRNASLAVNSLLPTQAEPGRYERIERTWKPGDRVELDLEIETRLVESPDGGGHHTALTRGPIVLARDSRLDARSVDHAATPVTREDGLVPAEMISPANADAWMTFRVPYHNGPHDHEGHMTMCDYASAGNAWSPSNRFRVWLPNRLDPSSG